jgi:hypothetical protein
VFASAYQQNIGYKTGYKSAQAFQRKAAKTHKNPRRFRAIRTHPRREGDRAGGDPIG